MNILNKIYLNSEKQFDIKILLIRTLLLLIILSNFSCSCKIYHSDNNRIDEIMLEAISDSVFPGAVLLFGNKNNVLYHKAFGNFTYDKSSSIITTSSIFDLASVTKVVATTSAAMLLVQEGKLNLDEKVISYLPEFDNNGKEDVTIRNLLVHNSGLAAFKKYYDKFTSAEEIIDDIMNLKLNNPPGYQYLYSDLGMITLQKVIEKVSGKSLDLFLNKKLFTPLEMNNTMYNPSKTIINSCVPTELDNFWRMRLLQGEVHDERAFMLEGVAGHAGLFSTALDLSKFAHMLMNSGLYDEKQIISSSIIDEWTKKQSQQSDRALGWDTKSIIGYSSAGKYFSEKSFGHTGYTGTSIWIDRENDLFVILLTNRVHPTRKNKKISKFRPIIHNAIFKRMIN